MRSSTVSLLVSFLTFSSICVNAHRHHGHYDNNDENDDGFSIDWPQWGDDATTQDDDEFTASATDSYNDCSDDASSYASATTESSSAGPTTTIEPDSTFSTSFISSSSSPSSSSSSSTSVAETTSSTATSKSAKSTSSSSTHTGRGTYYEPAADACGTSSSADDLVVAIAQTLYDSNNLSDEAVSGYCGKTITATYQGNSVTVKVVDACESCTDNDIDFSPAAFKKLADLDVGELRVQWSFDN